MATDRCCKRVYDSGRSIIGHPCQLPVTVTRNGEKYCRVHDPVVVEVRDKKRQAKWDAEWRKKEAKWKREEVAMKALELLEKMVYQSVLPQAWDKMAKAVLRGLQKR